jgi:hypothetical protein
MNFKILSLGGAAFANCGSLPWIWIPSSIETISKTCLVNCDKLATIGLEGRSQLCAEIRPEWLSDLGSHALKSLPSTPQIPTLWRLTHLCRRFVFLPPSVAFAPIVSGVVESSFSSLLNLKVNFPLFTTLLSLCVSH